MDKVREIFDQMNLRDIISWMVMIAGYSQNGRAKESLKLFQQMQWADVKAIAKTFASVLSACAKLAALDHGYAQNGSGEKSLKLFKDMQLAGVKPTTKIFASVLSACGKWAALEQGVEIHEQIIRNGFQLDVIVVTALLHMYAKCGSLDNARHLFDMMRHRDVVCWTAMIAGYAMHGYVSLVYEGLQYFNCMRDYYHIIPTMEHYCCMVDLISHAGQLDEAEGFINKMPIKPDASVWMCSLGACKIHNNIELGESVAKHLFELDVRDAAPYVLLSNIYAMAGRWREFEKVRKIMKVRGVKKTPGCSWIEVNKQGHAFLLGER
eukprot:PITA_04578